MKLLQFQAKNVNGFLNFDIEFYDDVTFLTGINGSGKTTVLNLITLMLIPKWDTLLMQNFEELSLKFSNENDIYFELNIKNLNGKIYVSCSTISNETFEYSHNEVFNYYTDINKSKSLYGIIAKGINSANSTDSFPILDSSSFSQNQIFRFIIDQPTPNFLGLNRISKAFKSNQKMALDSSIFNENYVSSSNFLDDSLEKSLKEALKLFSIELQKCNDKIDELEENFQKEITQELLVLSPLDTSTIKFFSNAERKEKLDSVKNIIISIPDRLNLLQDTINEQYVQLEKFIFEKQNLIAEYESNEKFENQVAEARNALLYNDLNIEKMHNVSSIVQKYEVNKKIALSNINEYISVINDYFVESGKFFYYMPTSGKLSYKIDDVEYDDLYSLSSGEIQLVVMFAHLYFNEKTKNASVFIIDEPEASLHLRWQQNFVNSILHASDSTQLIIATHAPTIIIGRERKCKELRK